MKRLTIRNSDGTVSQPTTTSIEALFYRLAAYEDTGLEPEEIKAMIAASMGKAIAEIKEFEGVSIDRLRELAEADKEGRCILLPIRVGGSVWIYDRAGEPQEMVLVAPDIRCRCIDDDIFCENACSEERRKYCLLHLPIDGSYLNRTVFLTREAAEAALKEREQNG